MKTNTIWISPRNHFSFFNILIVVCVLFLVQNKTIAQATLDHGAWCDDKLEVSSSWTSCSNCYSVDIHAAPWNRMTYYFRLERRTTGSWSFADDVEIPSGGGTAIFSVSDNDSYQYRVRVSTSAPTTQYAYNSNGQHVGYVGYWQIRGYSNVYAFGDATVDWSFWDSSGPNDDEFDADEIAYMDASDSYGYDRYKIKIVKEGSSGEVLTDWIFTTDPLSSAINLTDLIEDEWVPMSSGDEYHVMLAVAANCDPDGGYNESWENFTVCPSGSGCRLSSDIVMYPNPTSDILRIKNAARNNIERVELFNTMGQVVNNIHLAGEDEFPVRDISPGNYIVKLFSKDNKLLQTERVMITK